MLAPAFDALAETAEQTLYVDGAARLVDEHRWEDLSELNALLEMLERRVTLLGVLREVLSSARRLRPDRAREQGPGLHSLALVAASYGLRSARSAPSR